MVWPSRLLSVLAATPSEEQSAFFDLACTVGAFLVFPVSTYADGKLQQTINQRRGMHPLIRDRFDLTLECIRRHYAGSDSPLGAMLTIHAAFFNLFENFRGYVEHFLLQDLVGIDFDSVRFLKDFDDSSAEPLPAASAEEYREYMRRSMAFTEGRNKRIAAYESGRPIVTGDGRRAGSDGVNSALPSRGCHRSQDPFGTVGPDGALLSVTGHQTFTVDAESGSYTAYSLDGRVRDRCAALEG